MTFLSWFSKKQFPRNDARTMPDGYTDFSGIWNAPSYVESRHIRPDLDRMEAHRCLGMFSDAEVTENYTQLRTQILRKIRAKGWNTIMITSAEPGAGKTVTAVNLALTFAKTFEDTVLLVDCDLRKQRICDYMGLPGDKGLADIILEGVPMNEVMVWPGIEKMTVISGGRKVNGSAELLGSPRMAALVDEMKNRYSDRYVFFDVPAALQMADALTVAPLVDCVLIVVEEGKTTHSEIQTMLGMFPREKILGYVVNKRRT